jgi:hypothetical protein
MHAQDAEDDACIGTQQNLGAYIRGGMSRREGARVQGHLGECRRCMGVYLELTEVNSNLRGILAPLILGGSAAAYLGSGGGLGALAAIKAGALFLAGRARDLALANAPVSAVAGVAATAAVATGVVIVATPADNKPNADRPAAVASAPVAGGNTAGPGAGGGAGPGRRNGHGHHGGTAGRPTADSVPRSGGGTPFVTVPLGVTTDTPSDEPTDVPSETPTDLPTDVATEEPTDIPTDEPSTDPSPTGDPEHDLAVVARATPVAGLAWSVDVDVQGLPAGEDAVVTVTSSSPTITLTLDPRCLGLQLDTARCQVQAPATLQFLAVPVPGQTATLTFTVSYVGDVTDPDPSNNSTTVDLHS